MTRLRHSAEGYRRLLQISGASLVLLVEGPSDVYFYSRIAAAADLGVTFAVRPARELPRGTGGKRALLDYFDYLRRRDSLCTELSGKLTATIFLVDKDVEDVLRTRRRSPHVVYTGYYEMENYLFLHGRVLDALAAVMRVEPVTVGHLIAENWPEVAAGLWRDWIVICLVTRLLNLNAESNFGVGSRVNTSCAVPADLAAVTARLETIRNASGVDAVRFDGLVRRVRRLVEARFGAGMHATIFRGKWYASFLRHWTHGHGRTWSDDELESVLSATMGYDEPWSSDLRRAMNVVVNLCVLRSAA